MKGKGIISHFPTWYNKMKKLNCKEVNEALKKEIMDSYESAEEYYTYDGAEMKTEYNDICKDIMEAFKREKLDNDLRYKAGRISKQDLFVDWMQGLPTAFPVADDIFLGSAAEWLGNILDETETEKQKYSDSKAERTSCLILYRELNKHAQKAK